MYEDDPIKRLDRAYRERDALLIYEDKKIEEITNGIIRLEQKVNKIISMLTAHDYACRDRLEKIRYK